MSRHNISFQIEQTIHDKMCGKCMSRTGGTEGMCFAQPEGCEELREAVRCARHACVKLLENVRGQNFYSLAGYLNEAINDIWIDLKEQEAAANGKP